MIVDTFKECPCGSGKKTKFCCSADIVNDLDKVLRALAGDQRRSALDQVERLIATKGPRAALLVIQANLQIGQHELEQHRATVARLLEVAPANPAGLAFSAILQLSDGLVSDAVDELQRAIESCRDAMPATVYSAIGVLGRGLISAGYIIAGRAHLGLQCAMRGEESERAEEELVQIDGNSQIPPFLKQPLPLSNCPAGVDWEQPFAEAARLAVRGTWASALTQFVALAQSHPQEPAIMKNIALLCGWLGNHPLAVGAWRKFAGLPGVPEEDAVEAEAIALLLDGLFGLDPVDEVSMTYEIDDLERVMERVLSDRHFEHIAGDLSEFAAENQPPPRGAFVLLDHLPDTATREQDESQAIDQYPVVQGIVLLFGKETNRAARVVFDARRDEFFDANQSRLLAVLQSQVGHVHVQDVAKIGLINYLLGRQFHRPKDPRNEAYRSAVRQWPRKLLFDELPRRSLTALGGKTLPDAVADPALRRSAEALLTLLEVHGDVSNWEIDFNELRRKLGLPEPPPTDPRTLSDVEFAELRCNRWARLPLEELSDDQIGLVVAQAALLQLVGSAIRFSRELNRRPSMAKRPERIAALQVLIASTDSPPEVLRYIFAAADLLASNKTSPAQFLLSMLIACLRRGMVEVFQPVFEHVRRHHLREPGVAQGLHQILVATGAITPDGKPSAAMAAVAADAASTTEPAAGAGLWTPDGGTSTATAEPRSKLWLPGMD